jgi:hypothetical protein
MSVVPSYRKEMTSYACKRAMEHHGRGDSKYRTCRKHSVCQTCRNDVSENMSNLYQETPSEQYHLCIAYGNSHDDCIGRTKPSRQMECTAYCANFTGTEQDTCVQSCMHDGNSFGTYIELVQGNDADWKIYKKRIHMLTKKLRSSMKHASAQNRAVVQQSIEQLIERYETKSI